ncbi:outer membrane protein assembly factor BamB family protein [Humisphaera borealis]|uniref:PQQ-binding-like beta-propeller repeat protein n=1 Tax=Humisphaera borealis TaxID=2807512 RepID=A0A7M2X2L7_9BACT|nr:PQQ-binding-like beta-propeller repeat protein [Humisphaera borealis]QOV91998.1 PQQ-binding-like beta-propeller repeat protein [Humisphaera borealis]
MSQFSFPRFLCRFGRSRVATALVAVAALSATMFSAGCGGDGETPGDIQVVANPGFARQWATNLKIPSGDKVRSIFVRDAYIVVYSKQGVVYGLARENGDPRVSMKVPGGDFRMFPPIILKEHLVFPTLSSLEIYSLTGAKERTLEIGAAIRADCVGATQNVFVPVDSPDGGARIKRYDLNNKAVNIPVWELQAWKGGLASAPALHTDTVYLAAETGTVYAVTAQDREPIWPLPGNVFDAHSAVTAPLRADDVGLYISTVEGKFYCVNRTSGQVKWQWYGSGPLEEAPVPLADTVYIKDPNRGWVAVDKVENPEIKAPQYNRKERWVRDDIRQVLSQDDRYTYALTKDNRISALDKKTGQTKFQSKRNDFYVFATNAKDSTIYTCSEQGRVVAVRPVLTPGSSGEVVMIEQDKSPEGEVAVLMLPVP